MSYDSGNDDGPRRRRGGGKFARFGRPRRVLAPEEPLEYKNVAYLSKYIGPTGKIMSRRRTSFSGQDQRKLALAIKNARLMALMPYVGRS